MATATGDFPESCSVAPVEAEFRAVGCQGLRAA